MPSPITSLARGSSKARHATLVEIDEAVGRTSREHLGGVAGGALADPPAGRLVGAGLLLLRAASADNPAPNLMVGLVVLSAVLSWASVHAVFTLRYAHLYYTSGGGIDWHADDRPDFGDFAYVALTLGMTFQVSDTDIRTKQIRKAVIRHALLSYLFGVVVLATTINVIASLLAK